MWRVCAVMLTVPVRGDVMRDVFMHWSNMLARLVSRTISG